MIFFPNDKKSKIEDYNLDDFNKFLKTLYEQTDFACYCYHIGNRIYNNLENRYKHLEKKWYIFALNSLDDNMVLIMMKLYNDQTNEISLYNILNHFCIESNFYKYFTTPENQLSFKKLIEDFNRNYASLREKLIKRRNNWQIHITNLILNKEKFDKTITLDTKECFNLLYYALHTIRKVYKILFNEDLPINNYSITSFQIDKFFSMLDSNGDLK